MQPLTPSQLEELENELASTLKEEISRELGHQSAEESVQNARVAGQYIIALNSDSHLIAADGNGFYSLGSEPKDWLEANTAGRYTIRQIAYAVLLDFGCDGEAATLFKLFWQ
jgi:hypothetical protein